MVKSKKFVRDWVNSAPSGIIADVENDWGLNLSGSAVQTNQETATTVFFSVQAASPQSLEFNTHSQVEANHLDTKSPFQFNNNHEQAQPQYSPLLTDAAFVCHLNYTSQLHPYSYLQL